MVSDRTLDAWIARNWDERPPWDRTVFVEWFEDEQRDLAKQRAESLETKRIAALEAENRDLRTRLARIEKTLGPGGKTLLGTIAQGTGDILRRRLDELHADVCGRIKERPAGLHYAGVWLVERDYPVGTLVTHGGAGYIAIAPAAKGERPGTGGSWRLAIKSDEAKLRKMIKEELRRQQQVTVA